MGTHKALRGGGQVDDTANLDPCAYVSGDSIIDQWSYIGKGVNIYDRSYVATHAFVDDGAIIIHSNVGPFSTVGKGAILNGVAIGERCIICPGARVTADVPDETTITSDCCGGADVIPPSLKYSLLAEFPYLYKDTWNFILNELVYGAPATNDWVASPEGNPIRNAFGLPFLNADNVSIDRIVFAGFLSVNNFATPTPNGLQFQIVSDAGVVATGIAADAGVQTGVIRQVFDTPFVTDPNLAVNGLAVTLQSNSAAGVGDLDVAGTISLYHKNF